VWKTGHERAHNLLLLRQRLVNDTGEAAWEVLPGDLRPGVERAAGGEAQPAPIISVRQSRQWYSYPSGAIGLTSRTALTFGTFGTFGT
jgi:hypothetical protein